jgi:hypothetical protein
MRAWVQPVKESMKIRSDLVINGLSLRRGFNKPKNNTKIPNKKGTAQDLPRTAASLQRYRENTLFI